MEGIEGSIESPNAVDNMESLTERKQDTNLLRLITKDDVEACDFGASEVVLDGSVLGVLD